MNIQKFTLTLRRDQPVTATEIMDALVKGGFHASEPGNSLNVATVGSPPLSTKGPYSGPELLEMARASRPLVRIEMREDGQQIAAHVDGRWHPITSVDSEGVWRKWEELLGSTHPNGPSQIGYPKVETPVTA